MCSHCPKLMTSIPDNVYVIGTSAINPASPVYTVSAISEKNQVVARQPNTSKPHSFRQLIYGVPAELFLISDQCAD